MTHPNRLNRPGARPTENPVEQRNTLATNVEQDAALHAADTANQPPAYRGNIIRKHSQEFLRSMDATGKQLHEHLAAGNWEDSMQQAFATEKGTQKATTKRLSEIFENLQKDVPDESGLPKHPYIELQRESVREMKGKLITARVSEAINHDIQYIKQKMQAVDTTPERQQVLQQLLQALEQYVSRDYGRQKGGEWTAARNNHFSDHALLNMGRIGGTLVAGSAALFCGIMAWKGGKSQMPALFYAGVTGLCVFPGVLTSLFGGKNQASLNEIDKTVNRPDFKAAAKKHNVQGPRGRRVAEAFQSPDQAMNQLIAQARAGSIAPADAEAVAQKIHGTSRNYEYRQTLDLLQDPKAVIAFAPLAEMTDAEARTSVSYYLSSGAAKYHPNEVKKAAEAAQEAQKMA